MEERRVAVARQRSFVFDYQLEITNNTAAPAWICVSINSMSVTDICFSIAGCGAEQDKKVLLGGQLVSLAWNKPNGLCSVKKKREKERQNTLLRLRHAGQRLLVIIQTRDDLFMTFVLRCAEGSCWRLNLSLTSPNDLIWNTKSKRITAFYVKRRNQWITEVGVLLSQSPSFTCRWQRSERSQSVESGRRLGQN